MQHDPLLAAVLQSRTAKDVIRRLKYRFASEGQADVMEDPTCYDWLAAGDHCFHLFGCAVGEHSHKNAACCRQPSRLCFLSVAPLHDCSSKGDYSCTPVGYHKRACFSPFFTPLPIEVGDIKAGRP